MRIGNGKIDYFIISKLINNKKITSKEIDVLLWIARRQDAFGRTFGIKYNEVCEDVKICFQEFYNCISGLENKTFIRIINRNRQGWDIEIIDNKFTNDNDDKRRYLNINRDVFYSDTFISLRANEKKVLFKILLQKTNSHKPFFLRIDTIINWIGIDNIQLINSYIVKLRTFLNITIAKKTKGKNSLFVIVPNIELESVLNRATFSIKAFYLRHKLRNLCRQYNATYNDNDLNDVITLFNQYGNYINILEKVIVDIIHEKGSMEPKLINYIMSTKCNLPTQPTA